MAVAILTIFWVAWWLRVSRTMLGSAAMTALFVAEVVLAIRVWWDNGPSILTPVVALGAITSTRNTVLVIRNWNES